MACSLVLDHIGILAVHGMATLTMKASLYINLQRKIIIITLLVSLSPLIVLGVTIYHQFARMYEEKIKNEAGS